uniref:Odorant receptor n=2 Tax=Helicoverpa zea TaxID=7113 RepID=A0A8E4HQZ1_HELZE|nr:olfactory receptor OR15 [Helicoverpa zea]
MTGFCDIIFNYQPNDGITTPTDYPYMIIARHLLTVITMWPKTSYILQNAKTQKRAKIWLTIQKAFHFWLCVTSFFGGTLYILRHKKSMTFYELGHLYISLLMIVCTFSRITTLCLNDEYRVIAKDFVTKIHLFFYKDLSDYSMETHKKVHMISHIFTLYLSGQMMLGLFLFNVTPMYNNYSAGKYMSGGLKNSTYEHALYFSWPFNASTDFRGYVVSNILHWLLSFSCSSWFCVVDFFLSLMVFHVWGHFKILLHDLNHFPRPSNKISFILEDSYVTITNEIYTRTELDQVFDRLNKCIDYHREIVSFTDKMSEVFGPMLLAYYGFHQASGCLLLLECSQMTVAALVRYLPLTIILFQQLIQMSIIFELVGSVSDKLKDAVYGLPWEAMDTKNRRIVAFFLMNVQEPVHVKALGLADVGVTSMTAILKTSMSYFAFLRSM